MSDEMEVENDRLRDALNDANRANLQLRAEKDRLFLQISEKDALIEKLKTVNHRQAEDLSELSAKHLGATYAGFTAEEWFGKHGQMNSDRLDLIDKLKESNRLNSELRDLLISVDQAYTLTFSGQRGPLDAMFRTVGKYLKEQQTEKRLAPAPLAIDTRCPKCKQLVDNVIHFCPAQ